jgi:hypothetical protein
MHQERWGIAVGTAPMHGASAGGQRRTLSRLVYEQPRMMHYAAWLLSQAALIKENVFDHGFRYAI